MEKVDLVLDLLVEKDPSHDPEKHKGPGCPGAIRGPNQNTIDKADGAGAARARRILHQSTTKCCDYFTRASVLRLKSVPSVGEAFTPLARRARGGA